MTATLSPPMRMSSTQTMLGGASGPDQGVLDDHGPNAPDPTPFLKLRILAECFHDTQQNRISCVNRMERGGIPPEIFNDQIDAIVAAEHQLELVLVRQYRTLVRTMLPGVDEWQRREKGIGEKLLARLLGHLGHPRIATPYRWEGEGKSRVLIAEPAFERTVSQLRSYCGHGDPARRRQKGMSVDDALALGSPMCKMLVHLLAENTMKRKLPIPRSITRRSPAACGSSPEPMILATPRPHSARDTLDVQDALEPQHPGDVEGFSYRRLYEQRRTHTTPRDDWTDGHKHNDALRIVGKQILADLWEAADRG